MTDDRPIERGREPGNWELMRGIERLERRFDEASKGFVTTVVHNLLVERVRDLESEVNAAKIEATGAIVEAKKEAAGQIAAVTTELNNAKKSKNQMWTTIGIGGALVVIGTFWDVFTKGLGIS